MDGFHLGSGNRFPCSRGLDANSDPKKVTCLFEAGDISGYGVPMKIYALDYAVTTPG